MSTPNFHDTDFAILGVPQQFEQEDAVLLQHWKDLQAQMHPDRFVSQGPAAQRLATQWSVRINEAYQKIKNPVSRAALLCDLAGIPINAESNTTMPPAFLMQQMQWREDLEDAQTLEAVEQIQNNVHTQYIKTLSSLAWIIDEMKDYNKAAEQTRTLMFMERFFKDIDKKMDLLDI